MAPRTSPEDALLAIYRRAEATLRAQIRQGLRTGRLGTAAYQRALHEQIRSILRQLGVRTRPAAGAAVLDAYMRGVDLVAAAAEGRFGVVHSGAVATIADRLAGNLEGAAATMGQSARAAALRSRRILEATATGLAAGETRRETTLALMLDLERDGVTALVDRAGRRWTLERYARMAVRTETRVAQSEGTANRLDELGQVLVTISRHVNACEVCVPYQGRTWALPGKTHPEHPTIDRLPPFHPLCAHVAHPAAESLDALERELGLA